MLTGTVRTGSRHGLLYLQIQVWRGFDVPRNDTYTVFALYRKSDGITLKPDSDDTS